MAHTPGQESREARSRAAALILIRICVGIYMFAFGFEKTPWLLDSTPLTTQLSVWLPDAPAVSRWFIERIIPGAPVFARLVPVEAMLGGIGLALGFWTRLAAALSLMVTLSLQLAAGSMFKYEYLSDASGLLLIGSLVGLMIGGGKLPFSARR